MLKTTKGQEATGGADAVKRRKSSHKPEVEEDGGRYLAGDSRVNSYFVNKNNNAMLIRGQLTTLSIFVSICNVMSYMMFCYQDPLTSSLRNS